MDRLDQAEPQTLATMPEGKTKSQGDGCTMARNHNVNTQVSTKAKYRMLANSLVGRVYVSTGRPKDTREYARRDDRAIVQRGGLAFMLRGHLGRLK